MKEKVTKTKPATSENEAENKAEKNIRYFKQSLIHSKRYMAQADLLSAVLEEDKTYTLEEVNEKIVEFQKGAV